MASSNEINVVLNEEPVNEALSSLNKQVANLEDLATLVDTAYDRIQGAKGYYLIHDNIIKFEDINPVGLVTECANELDSIVHYVQSAVDYIKELNYDPNSEINPSVNPPKKRKSPTVEPTEEVTTEVISEPEKENTSKKETDTKPPTPSYEQERIEEYKKKLHEIETEPPTEIATSIESPTVTPSVQPTPSSSVQPTPSESVTYVEPGTVTETVSETATIEPSTSTNGYSVLEPVKPVSSTENKTSTDTDSTTNSRVQAQSGSDDVVSTISSDELSSNSMHIESNNESNSRIDKKKTIVMSGAGALGATALGTILAKLKIDEEERKIKQSPSSDKDDEDEDQ